MYIFINVNLRQGGRGGEGGREVRGENQACVMIQTAEWCGLHPAKAAHIYYLGWFVLAISCVICRCGHPEYDGKGISTVRE